MASQLNLNACLGASVLLTAIIATTYAANHEAYSGFSVYRCSPQTDEQVDSLRELQMNQKEGGEIDFWKFTSALNGTADLMVSPDLEETIRTQLRVSRTPYKKIIHDVGEVIRRTSRPSNKHGLHRERFGKNLTRMEDLLDPNKFYTNFQAFGMIEAKLKALAESDPRVKLEEIGKSYERRPLYLVKVSSQPEEKTKPVIFIDAGHHAREWASHSTILYVLESLLGNKLPTKLASRVGQSGANLTAMLEKYDFWLMPVVNPDGYEYSHGRNGERFWRKTRSPRRAQSTCVGVDPNRNYPFKWQYASSSGLFGSCSETYPGERALSEPETEALANLLLGSDRNIVMYLTLHAYAGMILSPYGYARLRPENYDQLRRTATAGADAIRSLRGTNYDFGTASELLYEAPGGSDDFAYAMANVKLSYTIELAEQNYSGFLLPTEEIVPTGQEMAAGIAAMVNAI